MKKKVVKKAVAKKSVKSKLWIWIVSAFLFGALLGTTTYYLADNWKHLFSETLKCDDGNKPDKNGCCVGEVYTDVADGLMLCCLEDNCFPPIK